MIAIPQKRGTESIAVFNHKIQHEFRELSGIDRALWLAAVEIRRDLEPDEVTGEPTTPIHDALGWKYTRFARQANEAMFAAILLNEDGSPWQLKLSKPRQDADKGSPIKYETPKGNGARAFLPPVPPQIRRKIADRYQVEAPLDGSFWEWFETNPDARAIPIIWTEGGKKSLCLMSHGYVAIALYGVNGGYRKLGNSRILTSDVARFAQKGRGHILAFDQDAKQRTRQRVNGALFQFGRLLTHTGGGVAIASWDGTLGKGVDDLIVGSGIQAWEEVQEFAVSFDRWVVKGYTELTFPANLRLNQARLGVLPIPDNARLIGIQSPKNTGKSWSQGQIVKDAYVRGQRVLVVSHRRQLCQSLCDRLGIRSVLEMGEVKGEEKEMFVHEIKDAGMGLCIDSLHPFSQARFNAEEWADALIIFDEAEQIFWHVLNSGTCKAERVAILQELQRLLMLALDPDGKGRVLLADADLSDTSINFVRRLAGYPDLEPWICVNDWQPSEPWQVFSHDCPESLLMRLEERISDGERVLVMEDSQRPKGRFSTYALEKRWGSMFPGKRILRIDSQTLELKDHPAFGCISGINEILLDYDIVLCSPSVETGISIDIKGHFGSVWGLFWGVTAANSVRQGLFRLREPVERHIWLNKTGLGRIGRGETSVQSLLESESKLVKTKLYQCYDASIDQDEIDTNFAAAALDCWARMAVVINSGMANFRASVLEGLKQEGHHINILEGEDDRLIIIAFNEELCADRDANQQKYGEKIAAAPDLSREEAEALEAKQSKESEAEQLAFAKFRLRDRYAVGVTPELYLKDCFGWNPDIQLHYYLSEGGKYLKPRDRAKRDELVNGTQAWTPDLNRSLISDKVRVLEHFGVLKLLDKKLFKNNDPDLVALKQKAIANREEIKVFLGFSIQLEDSPEVQEMKRSRGERINRGDSAIKIAEKFLNLIGFDLVTTLQREGGKGEQEFLYLCVSAWHSKHKPNAAKKDEKEAYKEWLKWAAEHGRDDRRSEVFAAWTERHEERIAKAAEKQKAAATAGVFAPVVMKPEYISIEAVTTNPATTDSPKPKSPPTEQRDVRGQWQAKAMPEAQSLQQYRCYGRCGEWLIHRIEGTIAHIFNPLTWQKGFRYISEVPIDRLTPMEVATA